MREIKLGDKVTNLITGEVIEITSGLFQSREYGTYQCPTCGIVPVEEKITEITCTTCGHDEEHTEYICLTCGQPTRYITVRSDADHQPPESINITRYFGIKPT